MKSIEQDEIGDSAAVSQQNLENKSRLVWRELDRIARDRPHVFPDASSRATHLAALIKPDSSEKLKMKLIKKTKKAIKFWPCQHAKLNIDAAINKAGFPYGLQEVLWHLRGGESEKDLKPIEFPRDEFENNWEDVKFSRSFPIAETRKRSFYEGSITKVDRRPTGNEYKITYEDGDECTKTASEIRPLVHAGRARNFYMLEVFSGSGTVSSVFAKHNFVCDALDYARPSPQIAKFNPTLWMDFHDFDPNLHLSVVPDFCWMSLPCTTYSNLAGDKHRVVVDTAFKDANLDISPLAREQDFLLAKVARLMSWIRQRNPLALFAIENPAAKLIHMPGMVRFPPLYPL